MSLDYILLGGLIIDGESAESVPRKADIGIKTGRIEVIGNLSDVRAEKTIDISSQCVCPGFIDAHSHSEFTLLADGRAEGKICQGITTEINGNCGLSAAPLYSAALEHRITELKELDIKERWNSFHEYFGILSNKGIAVNFMTLVGHGNLRGCVAGYSKRGVSASDKGKIINLLRESLDAGAKGLSTGLIYPPGVYADTAEIVEIAGETSRRGGIIYTTHMRSEGDALLEALDEAIQIGFEARIPVHISHLKTSESRNWKKITEVFKSIGSAHKKGLHVTCDRYPYTASNTSLDTVLPSWVYEGGPDEEIRRIKYMQKEIENDIIKMSKDESYWDRVKISLLNIDKNKWMEGKSISGIAAILKKKPLQCIFDILIEEDLRVDAIFFSMNEDNLKDILKRDYTVIGSDSSARSFKGITAKGKPHPRGFGSFPRVLGKYVREQKLLSMGEAVYKMTGLTARIFGIKKRGIIKKGFFADITVFDPDRICDRASFENPFERPGGVSYVFVNGVPVMTEGQMTGALPGMILM